MIPSYCTLQVAYAIGDRVENDKIGSSLSSVAVHSDESVVILLSTLTGGLDRSCNFG